ncbi:formylmethanofuran dehydrogenase [Paraburkholderia aromaticivorans]|uniref:formylmethanofuran dehydrogenase n=1 Tax=Paraburkholderia aromaticivorans TaxID=2026199 RepID=UPI001455E7B4|nr:formylmethanofuran dehydrogenase [Paraburkholderia aromaticivorans]
MTSTQSPSLWTCPFCALLCDRFGVDTAGTLTPAGTHCPRATHALAQFENRPSAVTPLLNGQPADHRTALDAAAQWLRAARQPLFGGMATDVAGARALYRLANTTGAIIDHAHGRAMMHGLTAMQDRGSFTTTLAEIRCRADLIVCIGSMPSARHPEFFARCGIGSGASDAGPAQRDIVFVGCDVDPAIAQAHGVATHAIPLQGDLYDTLSTLNALLSRKPPQAADPALASLVEKLRAARYATLVWTPADLPGAHAALLVEALDRLLKTLNRTTRAGGLALGGDDGGATVNQTLTWLSGLPLRTGVHRGGLEHEPHRYDTARLLADRAVDSLLWIASFTADLAPPPTELPTIVLGHPRLAGACMDRPGPTVFLPVSTPGIGSPGHLFRADGGVVLPLTPVYTDTLPSVASVAIELDQRLAAQREGRV